MERDSDVALVEITKKNLQGRSDHSLESKTNLENEARNYGDEQEDALLGKNKPCNDPASNTYSEERLSRKEAVQGLNSEIGDDLTGDTQCGVGIFKGPVLQKFANKYAFILCQAILGLVYAASWSYFSGTIYTMEKRFKMSSKALGIISMGTDVSQLFTSTILSYWAGRGHRPRWIAFSIVMSILEMVMILLPHAIYGPGEEALALTEEYRADLANITLLPLAEQNRHLCGDEEACVESQGSFAQPAILFAARFIGGIGGGLFYSAGTAYLDDNIEKSEVPLIMSVSRSIRMFGPSLGFAVASMSLKAYIAPTLTPTITTEDPRWLGAWWIGWIVFIIAMSILVIPMIFFPKILPATAAKICREGRKVEEEPPSLQGLIASTRRILSNRIYVCNCCASVMYSLGVTAYSTYMTKYLETQYRKSASASNFVTGSVTLSTSITGILLSGFIIGKIRPKARNLALWNVFISFLNAAASVSFVFLGCGNQISTIQPAGGFNTTLECNVNCGCENVPYSPVCSQYNETYLSACHAGCLDEEEQDGIQMFTNCSCIDGGRGFATAGLCPYDCSGRFAVFVAIWSIVDWISYTGAASNFLLGIRCVDEKDKSAAMGLGLTLTGIFGVTQAPVLFGYIIDLACIVWGKTCEGTGNCWLYDSARLAYTINLTSAAFMAIGMLFDLGTWYQCKNLKIWDDEAEEPRAVDSATKNLED